MALLEITNVDISYGKRLIVKNCNITLDKGEICSIVGESGSGKTTVIRAVLGLLAGGGRVTAGDIVYEVNHQGVHSVQQVRSLLQHLRPGQPVALQVQRGGQLQYIAFEWGE